MSPPPHHRNQCPQLTQARYEVSPECCKSPDADGAYLSTSTLGRDEEVNIVFAQNALNEAVDVVNVDCACY